MSKYKRMTLAQVNEGLRHAIKNTWHNASLLGVYFGEYDIDEVVFDDFLQHTFEQICDDLDRYSIEVTTYGRSGATIAPVDIWDERTRSVYTHLIDCGNGLDAYNNNYRLLLLLETTNRIVGEHMKCIVDSWHDFNSDVNREG